MTVPSPKNDDHTSDIVAGIMEMPAATRLAPVQRDMRMEAAREIPISLDHKIRTRIAAVPGLTVAGINAEKGQYTTPGIPPIVKSLKVSVDGWSPSLHQISMEWDLNLYGQDINNNDTHERVMIFLESNAAAQALRAQGAAQIGIATPLPIGSGPAYIDHLTIDRSALALAVYKYKRATAMTLGKAIARLHLQASNHNGQARLNGIGVFVKDELHSHHLGWTVDLPQGGATLSDDILYIVNTTVPETLLASLPGRRLAELATVHPALDNRIIATAEHGNDALALRLEPDRVRIGDMILPIITDPTKPAA